jgi:2-oxoglutarate ferredoxin oxidoreductase subunit alpha
LPDFKRYEFTASGISPRSIPGQKNGIFLANSDESDAKGFSDESSENRLDKVHKRFKKIEMIKGDMPELNVYGDIRAKTCLMTWGSTKGPALEAMRRLQAMGIPTKLLALNYIEPFPSEEIEKFIKSSKKVVLIEGNYTSQLGKLITMNTGYDIEHKLLKYDGRPIYPDEIVNYVTKA